MRMLGRPSTMVPLGILAALAFTALLAPVLPLADPLHVDLRGSLAPPSGEHLLGTDTLGRDVLSRLVYAARVSLTVAAGAVSVAVVIGGLLGTIAGYFGGKLDSAISYLTDSYLAFPPILLAIAILGAIGRSTFNTVAAIAVIFVPRFIRVARAAVVARHGEVYLDAARVMGASPTWIIRRHVIPNIAAPIVVQAALAAGFAMLAEASLSFLGLGVQPPQASWGSMLGDASQQIYRQPLLIIWPGVAIALCVFCFNVLGEAIRDAVKS